MDKSQLRVTQNLGGPMTVETEFSRPDVSVSITVTMPTENVTLAELQVRAWEAAAQLCLDLAQHSRRLAEKTLPPPQ